MQEVASEAQDITLRGEISRLDTKIQKLEAAMEDRMQSDGGWWALLSTYETKRADLIRTMLSKSQEAIQDGSDGNTEAPRPPPLKKAKKNQDADAECKFLMNLPTSAKQYLSKAYKAKLELHSGHINIYECTLHHVPIHTGHKLPTLRYKTCVDTVASINRLQRDVTQKGNNITCSYISFYHLDLHTHALIGH
jgi:hypothetical protein